MQYIGNNEIAAKYVGDTEIQKQYIGDTLVWEKQQPAPSGPPNNEIWYTTSDGNPITITNTALTITSNTYVAGKGVLVFDSDLTALPNSYFAGLSTIMSLTLPQSVTGLGNYCFSNLSGMTSITGLENVVSVGISCFENCKSITNIELPSASGAVTAAFSTCNALTAVTIGYVTEINQSCFYGCGVINSITFFTDTPPTVGASGWSWDGSMSRTGTLYVPTAAVSTYETWKSGGVANWTVQAIS